MLVMVELVLIHWNTRCAILVHIYRTLMCYNTWSNVSVTQEVYHGSCECWSLTDCTKTRHCIRYTFNCGMRTVGRLSGITRELKLFPHKGPRSTSLQLRVTGYTPPICGTQYLFHDVHPYTHRTCNDEAPMVSSFDILRHGDVCLEK